MKSINNNLAFVGILTACSALYACGGGGNGDGGNNVDSQPPTGEISGKTLQLTFSGQVTDSPVANANIRFEIGNETFDTTADANGSYNLTVKIDESQSEDLVRAVATTADNPKLKLVSLLGSFELLSQIAGDDGTLTANESTAVNVTNVSTAMAGLIAMHTSVSTQDQLDEAKKSLDAEDLISLATSIKLILDYESEPGVQLPNTASDTLAFASSFDLAAEYAEMVTKEYPSLYDEAVTAILSDPNIVHTNVTDSQGSAAGIYYFTSPDGGMSKSGRVTNSNASGEIGFRLTLNEDGTGELLGSLGSTALTWQTTADGIAITGAQLTTLEYEFDGNTSQLISEDWITSLDNIRWLDRGHDSDVLLVGATHHISYPNGEYPDTAPVAFSAVTTAVKESGVIDAANIIAIGQSYSMPGTETQYYADTTTHTAGAMVFNGSTEYGGTAAVTVDSITSNGIPLTNDVAGEWEIDSHKHLRVKSDQQAEYVFLTSNNGRTPLTFVTISDGTEQQAGIGFTLKKLAPAFSTAEVPGIYELQRDYFSPYDYLWFDLKADGTFNQVTTYDGNGNGVLEQDEVTEQPGFWQLAPSGGLLMRRYRSTSSGTFCTPPTWDTAADDTCVLYHEREWKLQLREEDGTHWVRHYHRYFNGFLQDTGNGATDTGSLFDFGIIDNRPLKKMNTPPVTIAM
ncbi:hypothetical protein [Microbulbifer hainanensis]|uniref:hypothetical protein n=1 Tax=Microbulbifer hainanensis TaxID=2735675 RepID=UPI0018666CEE|nr:hypothetical protein [Microbulbifer hainanensis]